MFDALSAAAGRGVRLRIIQSQPTSSMPDDDSQALAKVRNTRNKPSGKA